jgi:uncharacterized protein YdeI (YjbR/CyaY-like superfamily)
VTPTFFKTAAQFRAWLQKHHDNTTELWLGMYKKGSGRPSVTYKEALDEALCFGWIDGVRKSLDAEAYVQRFTPRKSKSYWSTVNTKRAQELIAGGRMKAPGLAAFERRDKSATAKYSFERETAGFEAASLKQFRANRAAWAFFSEQAPYYRRLMAHWTTSAKREETRASRLAILIKESAAGRRVGLLSPRKKTTND